MSENQKLWVFMTIRGLVHLTCTKIITNFWNDLEVADDYCISHNSDLSKSFWSLSLVKTMPSPKLLSIHTKEITMIPRISFPTLKSYRWKGRSSNRSFLSIKALQPQPASILPLTVAKPLRSSGKGTQFQRQ